MEFLTVVIILSGIWSGLVFTHLDYKEEEYKKYKHKEYSEQYMKSKERQCTVTGQKITPDNEWISIDMFTGSIIECEQFIDTHEWHLQGYRDIKVVSAETPTTKPERTRHELQQEQPRAHCEICED